MSNASHAQFDHSKRPRDAGELSLARPHSVPLSGDAAAGVERAAARLQRSSPPPLPACATFVVFGSPCARVRSVCACRREPAERVWACECRSVEPRRPEQGGQAWQLRGARSSRSTAVSVCISFDAGA